MRAKKAVLSKLRSRRRESAQICGIGRGGQSKRDPATSCRNQMKANRPWAWFLSGSLLTQLANEPIFNFLAGPRSFAQEREAGLHGGIELEAADRNTPPHLAPAMPLDQLIEDAFQRDAVQWIAGMGAGSRHKITVASNPPQGRECFQRGFEILRDFRRPEPLGSPRVSRP